MRWVGKCQDSRPDPKPLPLTIKILASPKRGLESERFQQRPHPQIKAKL